MYPEAAPGGMGDVMQIALGDLVKMRKVHPCGSDQWVIDQWVITRTGADVKIKCQGCGRVVMLDRVEFEKRVKKIIAPAAAGGQ